MTNTAKKEFWRITNELFEKYGVENACENCPYKDECETNNLFYGCIVWEEWMGDDL